MRSDNIIQFFKILYLLKSFTLTLFDLIKLFIEIKTI